MAQVYAREEDTPAWKVFNVRYRISIPAAFALPFNHLKAYGTHSTGNASLDEQLASEQTIVLRTIADMAELHDMGVHINLLKPEEHADNIYHLVYDHIEDYEPLFGLKTRQIVTDAEKERFALAANDLVKLQEFADFVRGVDRVSLPKHLTPNSPEAILQNFMIMGNPTKSDTYNNRRPTIDPAKVLHRKPKRGGQWG